MEKPIALHAHQVEPRAKKSVYPAPFAAMMELREKRVLGDLFGLTNFGVNLTTIKPGGMSALRHAHATQDEFIYVVSGNPILVTNAGETQLAPGMCAGFLHANGDAHQLINRSETDAVYLEIGDRSAGDSTTYPDNDLVAIFEGTGKWRFTHKDGRPY
ncbi:MAG: cupin domain-containing protein [Turneriella sp.]|nr:cupin domain-containing protein [Turneriella sp.]